MNPPAANTVGRMLAEARFEVVPMGGVEDRLLALPPGSSVAVTCSPRRGIERTLDLAGRLAAAGHATIPHVSARLVRDVAHLRDLLARLSEAGFPEIFVIGGDVLEPLGPFDSAGKLLSAMAEEGAGFGRVGIGAYPDGHPLIEEADLLRALLDKQPFAAHMVTQICFDPVTVAAWLSAVRRRGVTLPVYLGIPGVLQRRKLVEISLRVGVGDSVRYVRGHGNIVTRLMRRGSYHPGAFLDGVARIAADARAGVAGLHINTFNQIESTERWRRQYLRALGPTGAWGSQDCEDRGGTAS